MMKRFLIILLLAFAINQLSSQTTAINESFETWPAPDWNEYQYEEGGWEHSTLWGGDYGYGGGNCAKHKIENEATDDWLVSPQISVESSNYELTFYERSTDLQYYTYSGVHISTASGNPSDGDFIELAESLQVEGDWVEHTLDLSAYDGENIYIAFVFQGASSCWTHWDVDEVVVSPASFIDGALTEIVNPTGINPNAGTEPVVVTLHNFGTSSINDGDIQWSINGNTQGTFPVTNTIAPGNEANITLGSFDFSNPGDYVINCELILSGDMNPSNDMIESTYFVTDPKDASLTSIYPYGFFPAPTTEEVIITLTNNGSFIINDFTVEWELNEVAQTDYAVTSLNLAPGEEVEINIGNASLVAGLNQINATINLSGDEDLSNNENVSFSSIGALWESFEGEIVPPEMWTAKDYPFVESFFPPIHGEKYYSCQTDNNYFGEISDTLFTPLLDIENGDIINFWTSNSAYFTNSDVLIWKDGNTGEIHLIGEIVSTLEQWDEVTMDISAAAGINYIGFVNEVPGSFGASSLDLITSTANVYLHDNDLGIRSFENNEIALIGEDHIFNVEIRNYGTNQVAAGDYTVKIMFEDGEVLTQQSGVALDSWGKTNIEVIHNFSDISNQKFYVLIDFAADDLMNNNQSDLHSVYSVPNSIEYSSVGNTESQDLNIPFNTGGDTYTLGTDDISQNLFYQDELNMTGMIYGIQLHYYELFAVGQYLPLNVWVTSTDMEDLSGGWIPQEDLLMVFSDTIQVYPGHNSVYIPFDEPYLVTGAENLAVQYQQYEPEWPFTACRFYSTEPGSSGPVRGIRLNDVYDLDISDLPDYWGEHSNVTYTTFVYEEIAEEGSISGTVTDENSNAIEDVKITVTGSNIQVFTNENGYYELPSLPYSSYEINAAKIGYYDISQDLELNQADITLDFTLLSLPQISLSGKVFGNNAPEIPLEGVLVSLSGYESMEMTTNTNGEFEFETVFGDQDYSISFSLTGYEPYQMDLEVEDLDIDLGDIILIEDHISAYNVWAVAGVGQAWVEWLAPDTKEDVMLQNDNNVNSYSLTNEPYEEVWLGNLFTNNELITITSIEVEWDAYELAHDLVTIDIMDTEGNIIVSSLPFFTHNDSTMTIDIPNISMDDDFYAMIHWKDNEEGTDAIVLDYAEGTPNTAHIKYPGEPMTLLSDILGNPDASFFIRVNTMQDGAGKSDKTVMGYNIYKGITSEIPAAPYAWEAMNTEPITDLSFTDENWTGTSSDTYTFAVEAIYEEGLAEFSFSNFIDLIIGVNTEENTSYKIYPNPATNDLYLDQIDAEQLMIYNILGELVYSEDNVMSNTKIDISHLENGNYIIVIHQSGGRAIEKLIISK